MIEKAVEGADLNLDFYPPDDRHLWRRALRMWNSYQLHQQGITYRDQGRLAWDGQSIAATAINEFLICSKLHTKARRKSAQKGK